MPPELIKMSCSHGTAADHHSTKHGSHGVHSPCCGIEEAPLHGINIRIYSTSNMCVRQTVSAPIKIVMECVSRNFEHLRSNFRPSWKDGNLWAADGELLGIWRIDIQQARVRIRLQERFLQCAREGMDKALARLQFGVHDDDGAAASTSMEGKGKQKGKGKGKLPTRHLQPVERGCFKHAPPECRAALGSLVFSEYPFTVSIRGLEEEHFFRSRSSTAITSTEEAQQRW